MTAPRCVAAIVVAAVALSAPLEVAGQELDIPEHRERARQGFGLSQFSLAVAYATGSGVPKDLVLAHMWTNIAAADTPDGTPEDPDVREPARSLRDLLEFDMTRAEIRRATDLAHMCMESGYRECGPGWP